MKVTGSRIQMFSLRLEMTWDRTIFAFGVYIGDLQLKITDCIFSETGSEIK